MRPQCKALVMAPNNRMGFSRTRCKNPCLPRMDVCVEHADRMEMGDIMLRLENDLRDTATENLKLKGVLV